MNPQEARLTAFCSIACPELFHAIVHRHEIFRHDPLDVPSVHQEARRAFASLLNKAGAGLPYGKILLLLGEAGSGKTHLMRAFRSEITSTASGYFAYMQMTSNETNYAQYVLTNVIDSLHQPYDEAVSEISGLMRLSNGLVEDPNLFDPLALEYLRDGELDLPRVFDCSDHLIGKLGLQNLNPDLLRVLLLLQRSEPHLKNLVLQYLRCHDLSHHDQQKLGGIRPLRDASGPREVIKSLAGLAWALEKTPFVLCLDQLEDIYELNAPTQERFLAAMRVVREVADAVPSLIVVIACLEDFYQKLKTSLPSPLLDRIEKDPEPVKLSSLRSAAEVEQLIIQRLQFLFAECEAPFTDEQPLFPFAADVPQKLAGFRARAVLELCRQARERSQASGQRPQIQDSQEPPVQSIVDSTVRLEQRWNDFYTGFKPAAPESETAMTGLLAWALVESVRELPNGCTVKASANEKQVYAETKAHGELQSRILVTICNERPQGGHLGHAVDAARERAQNQNRRCIITRSTVFPDNPRTQIAKKLGELIAEGGRRTVIEDSDWRAMQAMQTFAMQHEADPQFEAWLGAEKPLTKLKPVSVILDLDTLTTVACAHSRPSPPVIVETLPQKTALAKADKPVVHANGIGLGNTREITRTPVTINPSELTRHAAFLGGSGSGKTTLALHLIENLMLGGVPAVLIDRKGDLCSYANDVAWSQPLSSPELEARRAELRNAIDIALYTPGREDGRPLCLPVIPEGLAEMKPSERELAAKHTAGALAGMMGYKANSNDLAKTAVLQKALIVLAQVHPAMNLDDLLRIVHDEDPSLINAVG